MNATHSLTRSVCAMMMVLLLGATLHGAIRSTPSRLDNGQLAECQGGISFWKDPCTIDGLLFGIGTAGCMMGSLPTCMGAAGVLIKAWKFDDCF